MPPCLRETSPGMIPSHVLTLPHCGIAFQLHWVLESPVQSTEQAWHWSEPLQNASHAESVASAAFSPSEAIGNTLRMPSLFLEQYSPFGERENSSEPAEVSTLTLRVTPMTVLSLADARLGLLHGAVELDCELNVTV